MIKINPTEREKAPGWQQRDSEDAYLVWITAF